MSDHLFTAIQQGDLTTVTQILAAEAGAIEARTAEGLSPIMVAAYWGEAEVLERLLEVSKDLSMWEAATIGATGRVRQLVDAQPDLVTARSPDGFTALHLAVFFGHEDTARFLIGAGADVLARTDNALANQPLHAATASSDADARSACVRALLEAGAEVNGRQAGGFTPLMSAAQNGDDIVVDLLLAAGADPALEDDAGLTAGSHAAKARHSMIAERLRTTKS